MFCILDTPDTPTSESESESDSKFISEYFDLVVVVLVLLLELFFFVFVGMLPVLTNCSASSFDANFLNFALGKFLIDF